MPRSGRRRRRSCTSIWDEVPVTETRPDIVVILTDQERAIPPYESDELRVWRSTALPGRRWFDEHGVSFERHYTGSLACVPSRPTMFTGQYPDVHGVTQTDGLGKDADDSAMRWLPTGEVPTLGHWFRTAGYDTHYQGKWHLSHADLTDPATGKPLATNNDAGEVDPVAVRTYLDADPLDAYGFSGWIGPEPHGGILANSGLRRDALIADRVVTWLADRYGRRRAGDADALKPFLLVASFVNPHDIVLFPAWQRNNPLGDDEHDTPAVPPPPTATEDLSTKPAAQAAYRAAYPTGYAPIGEGVYGQHADEYRRMYYRLHAIVDQPLDRVRRAVTDGGSTEAVIVRSVDHGELLGAHGGLHQKWFNLYDEATRVPFVVARIGSRPTVSRIILGAPTSHVDLVPTLLGAAGIDVNLIGEHLTRQFSEFHPLPGRNLMPIVDGDAGPDSNRAVYLMTRDNILEGDSGASVVARSFGLASNPPDNMRISVPANVGANFEAIVVGLDGAIWKLVRTFDDPNTWSEPGERHLAADTADGPEYRTAPLPDEWELYDLTNDPIETFNRWGDSSVVATRTELVSRLAIERDECVPNRHYPWPYVKRQLR